MILCYLHLPTGIAEYPQCRISLRETESHANPMGHIPWLTKRSLLWLQFAGWVGQESPPKGNAMPMVTQRRETTRTADRTIVRNIHAPHAARRFCRTQLLAWRLPGLLDTVELCACEIASNAVQHGAGDSIEVRLILAGREFTVKIWDANGAQFPVMAVPDFMAESGRGLALVDNLSDRWGSYAVPTGKVVWCTCL